MAELVTISAADDGARLDRWLKKHYPELGFGGVQKILRTGQVRLDGKRVKGDARLSEGQQLRLPPQLSEDAPKRERKISARDREFIHSLVIYEDEAVIAINKPPGLATQGGTGIGRHVDGLLEGLAEGGVKPHLVHRLDKDTSGVLLLARNPKIARLLGAQFAGRGIRKYYWAITVPAPKLYQGKIRTALEKKAGADGEKVRGGENGKYALTYYQVMETAGSKLARVVFWPRTGRTHQIRVHAQEMGTPLLGDYKYGAEKQELLEETPALPNMLHLHARRLMLPHPVTGKLLDITAPLDPKMRQTWEYFSFDVDDRSDPFAEVE